MNIFVLHLNPKKCAKMHCDKHIVKMVLEYAQLLCTTHRIIDNIPNDDTKHPKSKMLYKIAHKNHPCTIWTRESLDNYMWLYELFVECCNEYTKRYGKIHLCDKKLRDVLKNLPEGLQKKEMQKGITNRPQCMPEYCKDTDVVEAYQEYYICEKSRFAQWNYCDMPSWWY